MKNLLQSHYRTSPKRKKRSLEAKKKQIEAQNQIKSLALMFMDLDEDQSGGISEAEWNEKFDAILAGEGGGLEWRHGRGHAGNAAQAEVHDECNAAGARQPQLEIPVLQLMMSA